MFDINFYDYGATYVRIPNESIKLDIDLELLFYILDEDTLVVYFKDFDFGISCYGTTDCLYDKEEDYSIDTFKKIMFYLCISGKHNWNRNKTGFNYESRDIVLVCRYLPELKDCILESLDFIQNYDERKKYGLFNIDFSPGYIITNRPQINHNISIEYLAWLMDGLILKVSYPNKIFLDVEWNQIDEDFDKFDEKYWNDSFFDNGKFIIKVSKRKKVLFYSECNTLIELEKEILNAKESVELLLKA